jgi:ubiquinone/menaquinone biosynthesis C-methylase UbiE
VLTREVAARVEPAGSVVGLDVNEGMLAVARRQAPDVEWRAARAEAMPFPDECFDAVVSQFGSMFFEDRPAALAEMMRVLRPDIRGWTLADRLDDAQFDRLLGEARAALKPFTAADSSVSFAAPAHIVTATRALV